MTRLFRGDALKQSVPLKPSVPAVTASAETFAAPLAAEAVILDHREERRRGSVPLAVERVVKGESVTADEQDGEPRRPVAVAEAGPAVHHGEKRKSLSDILFQ